MSLIELKRHGYYTLKGRRLSVSALKIAIIIDGKEKVKRLFDLTDEQIEAVIKFRKR